MKTLKLHYDPKDTLNRILFTQMIRFGKWEALYVLTCPFPMYCLN